MIPPIRRQRDDQRWSVAHGPERRGSAPEEKGDGEVEQPAPCRRESSDGLPAEHLDLGDHELLAKLERLDDAVFDAIAGDPQALDNVRRLWPQLCQELAQPLLAESQEHYFAAPSPPGKTAPITASRETPRPPSNCSTCWQRCLGNSRRCTFAGCARLIPRTTRYRLPSIWSESISG